MADLITQDVMWGVARGKINSNVRRKSILNRLLSAEGRARGRNCRDLGVMASPATITALGTSPGTGWGTGYGPQTRPDLFRIDGGTPVYSSGFMLVRAAIIAATGGSLGLNNGAEGNSARVHFNLAGSSVLLRVRPTTNPYRFLVNDQYISTSPSYTTNTSGTSDYFSLTNLGTAGVPKKISVELHKSAGFISATPLPTDDIWCPEDAPLIVGHGDSTVQGATCAHYADGYMRVAADLMGGFCIQAGSGGTAWFTGPTGYMFADRLTTDVIPLNPDLVILTASQNDSGKTSATVTANALAGMRLLRAALPDVPVAVLGSFPGITGPSASIIAAEQAVMDAFTTWADDFSFAVPMLTTTPYIIRGSKKPSQADGTTTSEIYMDDIDGAHPSVVGHAYAGRWIKNKVYAGLRALAAAA